MDGNELGLTGFHGTELCQPIWEAPPLSGPGGINPFNPDDFTFIVTAKVEVSDIPCGGGCVPRSSYGKMTNMQPLYFALMTGMEKVGKRHLTTIHISYALLGGNHAIIINEM